MAKFAFVVPPLTGHINPTLSIGASLLALGHEVSWISVDASLQEKLPGGGQLLLIKYKDEGPDSKTNEEYINMISKKNVNGIESLVFLYEEVVIPLNRYCYRGIDSLLDEYKPDVVIVDQLMIAGASLAYKKQIKYATSVPVPATLVKLDELPTIREWEVKQFVNLQKEFGLHTERSLSYSDLLTLVFTSKAFFGETDLPGQYQFVGPVLENRQVATSFDWEGLQRVKNRPKILVSIGTTFNHEHKRSFFAKVAEAFGAEDLTVVVVSDPELLDQWPDNFIVQRNIPQVTLLPLLDAVVCHGGHNTVCETLLNGIPLIVIPIAYDQSMVASQVARSGSGIRLKFNRFKASHLREALEEILNNEEYKLAAQRVKQSFEEAGGTQIAAGLLVQLSQQSSEKSTPLITPILY